MLALFLILFGIFMLARTMKRYDAETNKNKDVEYVVVQKNCPPHKWRWVEVKDQDGNTVTERLVCDLCGPLKVQS